MITERLIMVQILQAIGSRPDVRLWRQNVGVARTVGDGAYIRFGVPGAADLSGILSDGRRLEIEVKKPGGKQSEQQKAFQGMIERFGGVYILARSVDEAVSELKRRGY